MNMMIFFCNYIGRNSESRVQILRWNSESTDNILWRKKQYD